MASIYLISPPKVEVSAFFPRLKNVLETGLVPVFQLRLKDYENAELKKVAREAQKICRDCNTLFVLNDSYEMALDLGLDGVHLGETDDLVSSVRKKSPENFVIGASCYDSKHLAMEAGEQGADYISFGSFFPSKTKNSRGKPSSEILNWADEMLNVPLVAIGGINQENCAAVVKAGADFIAVISAIWDDVEGEVKAVRKLHLAVGSSPSH